MQPFKFDIRNLPFAGTVTRWHSVNCHRYPSIAEHSALVALYAREIAARVHPDLSAEQQVTLYELALTHDLSEIVTGDMPSPIKRALKAHFKGTQSPIDTLERAICPDAARLEDEAKQLSEDPRQRDHLFRIHPTHRAVQGDEPHRLSVHDERRHHAEVSMRKVEDRVEGIRIIRVVVRKRPRLSCSDHIPQRWMLGEA